MKKVNFFKVLFALIISCALLSGAAACTLVQVRSAYDVAVENGFVGTQEEWLESLKGADGKNGSNGRDGADGLELTIADLFEEYLKTHPGATSDEFFNLYLTLSYTPIEDAVNIAIRSVVSIECEFTEPAYDRYGRQNGTKTVTAAGSGVIYDLNEDGYAYIITNYHVVYDSAATEANGISANIGIYAYGDFSTVGAKFVGGSMNNDIAVIRANAGDLGSVFKAAAVADSNAVRVGQSAIAVGNPEGEGISATAGVISVDSETIAMSALNNSSATVNHRVIRVDVPINPGNSGGGLFNADGELIGIVNAKIVDSSVEGMGYAIPANVAVGIARNILDGGGTAKKCVLGVTQEIRTSKAVLSDGKITVEEDLQITDVTAGGLADGKLAKGDILVSASLNGGGPIILDRIFKLPDFLLTVRANDALTLTVLRADVPVTVDIVCLASSFVVL
ncbi:MAG: trypsin-like peptidase domain-containing protein [Clostridiales bacterium]|jgi:serine protease Do|nr:trypsin-like peptidase domain-containing protein [Clostridiales bacterium]